MQNMQIEDIKKLNINTDDVIVIRFGKEMSHKEIDSAREYFSAVLGRGVRVLVLGDTTDITVLSKNGGH